MAVAPLPAADALINDWSEIAMTNQLPQDGCYRNFGGCGNAVRRTLISGGAL